MDFSSWCDQLNSFNCAISLISTVLVLFVLRFIFRPVEWTTEWYEVGHTLSKRNKKTAADYIKIPKAIGKLPPVYPNGWFVIAESREVRKEEVVPVTVLGETLAVFRDECGNCRVLNAYCPHMGANMAIGGHVDGDCLRCPFHHWTFSGRDGRCVNVPYAQKVPHFASVKCWRVKETNGLIFIWYHAENEEPTWEPTSIDVIQNKSFAYRGQNVHFVNCHIQDIPENGADLWHFAPVHGTSFLAGPDIRGRKQPLPVSGWHPGGWFTHEWDAEYDVTMDDVDGSTKHVGKSRLRQSIRVLNRFSIGSLELDITQLGPGYVVMNTTSTFGPLIILQSVTPVKPMLQKVVNRVYCPVYLSLVGLFILVGEKIMIERDIAVWNHKTFLENPIVLKEDKTIAKYRRWFSQFYTEHSKTYSQAVEEYDW